jgi:hypothetical protein
MEMNINECDRFISVDATKKCPYDTELEKCQDSNRI